MLHYCEVCGSGYKEFELKQLHLVSHFKEKFMADLFIDLSAKQNIYKCPFRECHYRSSDNWKIITHYGVVHNIVGMYLEEYLKTKSLKKIEERIRRKKDLDSPQELEDANNKPSYGLDKISTHNIITTADQFQFFQDDHKCSSCEKVFETRRGLGNIYSGWAKNDKKYNYIGV